MVVMIIAGVMIRIQEPCICFDTKPILRFLLEILLVTQSGMAEQVIL